MPWGEEEVSAIILAGGASCRMGSCKAELLWKGKRLIEHQADKLRQLGIEDIIISGYSAELEGTRFVPDKFWGKGPLSGIHAGLLQAKSPSCLVTGIDTPLVPLEALQELIICHLKNTAHITVLSHGELIEPVIGVYDSCVSEIAENILQTDSTSVRALLKKAGYSTYPFTGDEKLLLDCNTPEDYEAALNLTALGKY